MKKLIAIAFLICCTVGTAQSEMRQNAADTFMMQYNNGDYKAIYNTMTPAMQNATTLQRLTTFLTKIKSDIGNLQQLELYDYMQRKGLGRAYYDGHFDSETVTVRITTNKLGQINGLYIKRKPYL